MSDLSDLHGIFPDSARWNAETGTFGVARFNPETGEREVQSIELGNSATFALDLATRQRGYGAIRPGLYDMRLTSVGSPPPSWPDDEEFKPAIGCWLWNPTFGEVRFETNAAISRQAITNVWDKARFEPQAMEGLQPVIRVLDRVEVLVKAVGKTFYAPVIKVIGWVARDSVPGWKERTPTVAPPAAPPFLAAASTPAPATPVATPAAKKPPKIGKGAAKPAPDDPPPFDDPIPWARR